MALPAFAVAVALAGFLVATNEPGPGRAVDIEAVDTPEPDPNQPTTSTAAGETAITVRSGRWLSETVPEIADQLPNVAESQLWAALDDHDPRPPFAPTASELTGVEVPGLSAPHLRWEGLLSSGRLVVNAESSAADVIEDLRDEFIRTAIDLGYDQAPETLGLSPYEVIVLASLVETADSANEDDRAKVARVLHNRLAEDLPIAVDAAYLYVAQDRDLTFTSDVLDASGPYGVRTAPGLPPTPIATTVERRSVLRWNRHPAPGSSTSSATLKATTTSQPPLLSTTPTSRPLAKTVCSTDPPSTCKQADRIR